MNFAFSKANLRVTDQGECIFEREVRKTESIGSIQFASGICTMDDDIEIMELPSLTLIGRKGT